MTKKIALVACSLLFFLYPFSFLPSAKAQTTKIKIMPLGDSITEGNLQHNSYRRSLWKKLIANYPNIDFVGSKTNNNGGPPPNPDFDMNNEAYSGIRADQILPEVTRYATTSQPDIVLIHLGTNDALGGHTVASTISELGQIIDKFRAVNPDVDILLAKIIPTTNWANSDITALNNQIPTIATQKNTSRSRVIIVDQSSGYDATNDNYDGLHPNNSGEEKMATKWYNSLTVLLGNPSNSPMPKPGDADGNGLVDGLDYTRWLNNYNTNKTGPSNGDFNNNGVVDGVDYTVWLNNYGK